MNRNLRILGIGALVILGAVASFLASHQGGNTSNVKTDIRNEIIHNSYFTQLIASGATTEKDLERVTGIRPHGDGYVGISKENLTWKEGMLLAKRVGGEVLYLDGGS